MEQINMENRSVLNMVDLYFAEIKFSQNKTKVGRLSLEISHKINSYDDPNILGQKVIEIITAIFEPTGRLNIIIKTIGVFEIKETSEKINQELKNELMKKNAVAIMLPFIRSQVALISAQPGLAPIMMPLINVNNLVDNNKE